MGEAKAHFQEPELDLEDDYKQHAVELELELDKESVSEAILHFDHSDDIDGDTDIDDPHHLALQVKKPLLERNDVDSSVESGVEDEYDAENGGDSQLKVPLRLQKSRYPSWKQQVLHRPYFTIFISVVDVIMLVVELIVNGGFTSPKSNPWLGVSVDTLITLGGKDDGLILNDQWWRLLTPVFLHVGIGHLLLNLLAQVVLGFQLERVLGTPRIAVLYFVSAIAGNLLSAVFLPFELEVGASTAIYGLGSYYLVDLMVHWSLVIAPGKYFAGLMIGSVVGLLFGLLPGIDNFAHIGGSAGGFLISLILVPRTKEGRSFKYTRLALFLGPPLLLIYFVGCIVILESATLRDDVWRCHWCEYLNCLPIFGWCS